MFTLMGDRSSWWKYHFSGGRFSSAMRGGGALEDSISASAVPGVMIGGGRETEMAEGGTGLAVAERADAGRDGGARDAHDALEVAAEEEAAEEEAAAKDDACVAHALAPAPELLLARMALPQSAALVFGSSSEWDEASSDATVQLLRALHSGGAERRPREAPPRRTLDFGGE
mmetsp:Transcript_27295/g.59940  ORF Transcript_27295/g.59940 Transcript_27295/m.59940 type:complete len:172 (+) Transcript_27295:692-1207(+)